jgi:DNA-binding NarL/FixJ family response regulator
MDEVRAPVNPEALTERETEVLRLFAGGKANKHIATSLFVSEKTDPTPRAS